MDLKELHHHAKRHGSWTMHLSASDVLKCNYRNNGNRSSKWYYSYWLHITGKMPIQISEKYADRLIENAFQKAMAS